MILLHFHMNRWIELNPDIKSLWPCKNSVWLRNLFPSAAFCEMCWPSSAVFWDLSLTHRPQFWSFRHTVCRENDCSHVNSSLEWSIWHLPEESTYLAQCLFPSPSLEGFWVTKAPAIIPTHFMVNRQMGRAVSVQRLSKSVSEERGMLTYKEEKNGYNFRCWKLMMCELWEMKIKKYIYQFIKSGGHGGILKYLLMAYQ